MRRAGILLAIAIAAAAAFAWLHHGSDEDAIRDQLTRLAKALHASEGSNPAFRAPRVRSEFDAILAETVHVTAAEAPSLPSDRRGLADGAVQLAAYYSSVDVDFRNVEIKLNDASTMAQVAATADLASGGEHAKRDARTVSFIFYKQEGTWRITSATVAPPDGAL